MPTALAISPHLDDAIFSAGGSLAGLAREGWRVIVATVFTASVSDPQGFALACQLDKGLSATVDYMALRREEDAVACAIIGAEPRWLPFPEAPHRGYHTADALFDGVHGEDRIVERLAPALMALIEEVAPAQILAPQAIGAHVDHVAVVNALRVCTRPIRWWTDFPYHARASPRPSPFAAYFEGLASEPVNLDEENCIAKVDAVAAYSSQLGFQFGSIEAAREQITLTGRVERYCFGLAPTAQAR